jgi:hypothetical protein
MISISDLLKEAEKARSKPPLILGSCDYMTDEFRKQFQNYTGISRLDSSRTSVIVSDGNGNQYTDGHTIVKLNGDIIQEVSEEVVYVDLSLDQFCDSNTAKLGISLGPKSQIPSVSILNSQMYDIHNDIDRKSTYTLV